MTSYEGLSAQIQSAAADPQVRSVVLDMDSPGGEATGMFSLAEQVRQLSTVKPVTALVNDMAASAAYGIASAANEIVVSPTSIVGSIGVVMTHIDRSKQLERQGVKPTLIYAGAHKVDGNPYGPLTDNVQADLQNEVLRFYDQFVGLVARGRTGISEQAIRDTEARTYIGRDALGNGLADRVATLDQILREKATARGAIQRSSFAMNGSKEAAPQAENAGISPEAHAAAVAAARAEGFAAGTQRCAAIMRSEEAQGREAQAMALAFDTPGIGADDAVKVLGAAPKASGRIPSIAARAASEAEFGTDDSQPVSKEASYDRMWAKSVDKINSSFTSK
jgi:signal peptide peptidase SppA